MLTDVFGRAFSDDQATGVAAFGAEVNQPVAGANDVQVVLDDDQRVTRLEQFAQSTHQLGNVIKMQAGGGFVKQKQRAFAAQRLAAVGGGFGGARQKACQLQALGFAARQGGHRLAELDVFEAYIHDGLQGADHIAVVGKQLRGFAHRQVEHIGHVEFSGQM